MKKLTLLMVTGLIVACAAAYLKSPGQGATPGSIPELELATPASETAPDAASPVSAIAPTAGARKPLESFETLVDRAKRTLTAEQIDHRVEALDRYEEREGLIARANRGELSAEGHDALKRYHRIRGALLVARYEMSERS